MDWMRRGVWATFFAVLIAVGCSGDGHGPSEATGSTAAAVAYCQNDQVVTMNGPNTNNVASTYTGYLPSTITTSTGVPSQFTAQISLTVLDVGVVSPDGGAVYETCNYNYPASGSYFVTPTNTCTATPPATCIYTNCPYNPVGYHFSGATNLTFTLTRTSGSTPLTASAEFGDNPIDDGNVCTVDSCSGVSASHIAETPGTSCSDGNLCNGTETCSATAVCVSSGNAAAGTPCTDSNVCNGVEACNGAGGCVSPGNAPNGTPCPNSTVCDGTETCSGGACSGIGTGLTVPASTTCTTSTCDPVLGIVTATATTGACAASYQPAGSATDPTVPTDFAGSTSFLYTGSTPIQTGVSCSLPTSCDIMQAHVAVVRGRVLDTDGSTPLSGAIVSILNHSEFGSTLSRPDGYYDLAVNGGGGYIVDYKLSGRLEAQRVVTTSWLDYTVVDDLILVSRDSTAPFVATNNSSVSQFSSGPTVTDADGTRHANVYIPANTEIQGYGGSTFTLRATEFTSGSNGPKMMPATLPPQSAYTYAVDLSVDETTNVKFVASDGVTPQPVYTYVENFLNMPVGSAVPTGYYDLTRGAWIASKNGVVVVLVSGGGINVTGTMSGGHYVADSGATLTVLGITADEITTLEANYAAGTQLWRVPMGHFTSFDCNWGYAYPSGAAPPPFAPPSAPTPPDDPCLANGSIIECQSQILAEEIPVFGTPYFLRYQSDRVAGRKVKIVVPITGPASPPAPLVRVDVFISVAGRQETLGIPAPATNQNVTWTWDRLDPYGRVVEGLVPATIRVAYVYTGVPSAEPPIFGSYPGVPGAISGTQNRTAREVTLDQTYVLNVGNFDAANQSFGGWTLSAQHVYEPSQNMLYRGDGRRQSGKALAPVVQNIAGGGTRQKAAADGFPATSTFLRNTQGIAVGPDGSIYFADTTDQVIRKIDVGGIITTFAGRYDTAVGTFSDGAAPTSVGMQPWSLTVGPDGNLYVSEKNAYRVLRITLAGTPATSLLAGYRDSSHATSGTTGDGAPANAALLMAPAATAVGSDGSVYIATGDRVRLITPDGNINTVAGGGDSCSPPNTGPASGTGRANLCTVNGVALGPDGSLYIASTGGANGSVGDYLIRRLTSDGMITTVAGAGGYALTFAAAGDGASALAANIEPQEIHFGPDGALYLADYIFSVVRRFDVGGSIQTFAGVGNSSGYSGDGGYATSARFSQFHSFAFAPDGSLYIADTNNARVRRVYFDGARISSALEVPSASGDEIYQFDGTGEHQATLSFTRGKPRQQLTYTSRLLTSITDGDNNTTTIDRGTTNKVKIIGPFNSQTTTITLDPTTGYATSVQTPNGDTYNMTHSSTGLLTAFSLPGGGTSTFQYDTAGYLVHDTDALTGSAGQSLAQTLGSNAYSVSLTTAQGLTKTFGVNFSVAPVPGTGFYPGATPPVAGQNQLRTFLSSGGLSNSDVRLTDGSKIVGLADGTLTWQQFAPDPRFGTSMQYQGALTTKKGTHTKTETTLKSATWSSPTDLFTLTSSTTTDCVNGTGAPTTCTGGKKTATVFTSSTNTELTTLPTGRQVKRIFDAEDRVNSVQVLGSLPVTLNAISYGYDTLGRPNSVAQGTRAYTMTYDATTGFVAQVKDVALNLTATNTSWDGDGRPKSTTLAGTRTLLRSYDADGNLMSLTTPNTNAHGLISNAVDLLGEYDPPASGASTRYSYDFDHNLAALLDPDGTGVYFHDPAGRLYSDGRSTSVFSGTTGLLMSETAGTESRSYTYDGPLLSTLASVSSSPSYSHTMTLTRDNLFHVVTRQITGLSSVSYAYDDDGNLITEGALSINRGSGSSTNGLPLYTSIGTLTETPTFDAWGALSNDAYASVYSVAYTRDAGGRVTQKVATVSSTPTTTTYVYDGDSLCTTGAPNDGRLCKVTIGSTVYGPYTYDDDGNRTDIVSHPYDAQDRATSVDGYTYSPGGRLAARTIAGQTASYTYDIYGNLTHVNPASGSAIDYVIDAKNQRVGKKVGGTLVQAFFYDERGRIAAELDGSGNVISQFFYGTKANVPDYMINTISGTSTTYRLITDQLGSVVMVVNASLPSTIAQQIFYDPWGKILSETNALHGNAAVIPFQPFGFAGGLHDRDASGFAGDGGWVRFGARDYDPTTGRWTTKDPIRFGGGLDVYAYCYSDPVNCTDITGLDPSLWDRIRGWFQNTFGGSSGDSAPAPASSAFGPYQGGSVPPGGYCQLDGGGGSGPGSSCPIGGGPGGSNPSPMMCPIDESGVFETCTLLYEDASTCNYVCHSNDELVEVPKAIPIRPGMPTMDCAPTIPVRRE